MAPSSRPPGFEPVIFVVLTLVGMVARGAVPLAENTARGSDRVIRVAADPADLPFTSLRREGFENEIASLVARDLGARLEYVWRERPGPGMASGDDACDLVLGVAAGSQDALTTAPYCHSSWVFVTRRDRRLELRSLDDPRLRYMKIAVPNAGGAAAAVGALARRDIASQVSAAGDAETALEAIADGALDVAILPGPIAGWLAYRRSGDFEITAVETEDRSSPFTFAVAFGVRKDRAELRDEIDEVLSRRRPEIERILDSYGVPRVVSAADGLRAAN